MTAIDREIWNRLLAESRQTHQQALHHFCSFPHDLAELDVRPHRIAAARLFENETLADSHPLSAAFLAASPYAQWRETYKGTEVEPTFLQRFGCYSLIGEGGAFSSAQMRSFLVYMPPGLHYPWHHHPAEEAYLVLAGAAAFYRNGEPERILGAGDISHHLRNQPHATTTGDEALIAYVVWKGDLTTKPIWTDAQMLSS